MNRTKTSLLILLFLGICFSSKGQGSTCPPNIDWEYGDFSIWYYYIGTCCPISTPTSVAASSYTGRFQVTSGSAVDPCGFFPIVAPGGGSYSFHLGNNSSGSEAEKARYYIHVPTGVLNFSLVYRYAVVLEDPSHSASAQPRFEVNAFDSVTGSAIPCSQFNYVASGSLPGFHNSFSCSSVRYKSWSTASIDLSGLGGTTVIVDFASGDCGYGGHFGYGYLDMSCGLFAISTVSCDTSSVALSSPSGYAHYTWYDSSTFATILDTFQTCSLPYPSSSTTYAVVLTPYTGYGCPDTLYTHVFPSHLVLHRTHDTTVCFGGSGSYTLTTGATDVALPLDYVWSASPSLSCTTCANPVATPTTTTTYYFTVTDAVGCFQSDSITIAGNYIGSTIATTNVSCYGFNDGSATATMTSGAPPYTFSWSTSPVQTTATAIHLVAGTYNFSVTDSTGCTTVSTITITQPGPTVLTLVGSTSPTLCGAHDGSITISGLPAGSTDTFSYTLGGVSNTVVLTASSAGVVVFSGLGQGVYDHISVVTSGCQYNVIGPITLTDPPIPAAPPVILQTYCQYDLPSALSATGTNLLWYGPGVSGSSTAPTPSTSTPGIDTYYVTQTIAGCVSPRTTDPVLVIAKPNPPIVLDTTYCQFSTAGHLYAIGTHLKWYTSAAGGTELATEPTPNTSTVGSTTWYVSQTVNGCESDRAAITVTILYLPVFHITQSRPYTCQFDTLTFNYDGPSLSGAGYSWVLSNGDAYVVGSSTTSSVVVRFDSLFFQTVTLTASDYGGRCKSSDTLTIHVVPQPTATSYLKENICLGDTVTIALSTHAPNADNYTWDFDGATVVTSNSNSGGPYSIYWNTPGVHVVKLTAYTAEGCKGKPVGDTVKVLALPDARIYTHTFNGTICLEDSLYLTAVDSNDYKNSYTWSPSHFFHHTNKPGCWGKIETPGYVKLTVANAFGCIGTDSVLIQPNACCTVTFPTAFTPNSDGKNDKFRPIYNGFHRFHYFRIQNRWGQTVFESANNNMEWDGTFGGVPQDMGVYFYVIKFDCDGKSFEKKGDVTLIR